MSIQHLPNTASVEQAAAVLREHGHVVIDELMPSDVMDQLVAEMQPYIDETPFSESEGFVQGSQRIGCLVARSAIGRELVMNPLVLGIATSILSHAQCVQLGVTEMISLHPGAPAQYIHQDELTFDGFPFPDDYVVSCNSLWAVTDFTEQNGGTRVVPGSHARARAEYSHSETVPVEMKRGSVLIFSSKLWHSGGANLSSSVRRAQAVNYAVGWVRQEENQFLACPPDIARTLPKDLLRLMGYQSVHGYGHVGAQADPMAALFRA